MELKELENLCFAKPKLFVTCELENLDSAKRKLYFTKSARLHFAKYKKCKFSVLQSTDFSLRLHFNGGSCWIYSCSSWRGVCMFYACCIFQSWFLVVVGRCTGWSLGFLSVQLLVSRWWVCSLSF